MEQPAGLTEPTAVYADGHRRVVLGKLVKLDLDRNQVTLRDGNFDAIEAAGIGFRTRLRDVAIFRPETSPIIVSDVLVIICDRLTGEVFLSFRQRIDLDDVREGQSPP